MAGEQGVATAVEALDAIAHRLRVECPWDREQDARSIVPHTVEEAYELADAAFSDDDAKLLDELGDVLFQVVFLSLLLEERDAGSLAEVAEHCRQKLIRRHPHVFGQEDPRGTFGREPSGPAEWKPPSIEVSDAAQVLENWDAIKQTEPGREPGIFGEVPENLPALLYARKLQRRAKSAGADVVIADPGLAQSPEDALGDRLFALVDEARREKIDPEIALRRAADRFRDRVTAADSETDSKTHEEQQ